VVVGEFLALTTTSTGDASAVSWTSSDEQVVGVAAGEVEARRPGSVTITASARDGVAAEIALTIIRRPGGYTAEEIDYFTRTAFGAEIGTPSPFLRRWRPASGPHLGLSGSPTPEDLVVLDEVTAEINALTSLDVDIIDEPASVAVYFVPRSAFQSVLPEAQAGSDGFVWVWWGSDDHLTGATVLVATDISQPLRDHVIREEVTQMLGLLQDSDVYAESIFYRAYSEVTGYLPIDRVVIELLYRPELSAGMGQIQAERVARTLTRPEPRLAGLASSGRRMHATQDVLSRR
jgi:hypothetical protein